MQMDNMLTASSVADRIIAGGEVTPAEMVQLLATARKEDLFEAAHRVTEAFKPTNFDFCAILNARCGRCSENCRWCAQSAHWKTDCDVWGMKTAEECLAAARAAESNGAVRFGIVTSGRTLSAEDVDAVVETMRGHRLGRVIYEGAALPNTGVPGPIAGFAAERVIHAPASGAMTFVRSPEPVDIGSIVRKGQTIGFVGGVPVTATLDGVLRGLIREGYPVTEGLKIADIDPRAQEVQNCTTVSDKARAIAGGVLEAMLHLAGERGVSLL